MSLIIATETVMAQVFTAEEPYAVVTIKPVYALEDALDVMSSLSEISAPGELHELRAFFGDAEPGGCPSLTHEDDGSFQLFVAIDDMRNGSPCHLTPSDEVADVMSHWSV